MNFFFLTCLSLIGFFARNLEAIETRTFSNSKVSIENDQVSLTTKDDFVSFMVVGDWGGMSKINKTPRQIFVANKMGQIASRQKTHFQVSLGDNFYLFGVKNVKDDRFEETFEEVYSDMALKNTPWFILLGNHDWYGNGKAQVEYSAKSKRWIMPSFNYTLNVFTNDGATKLVKIIVVDTILMCGNTPIIGDSIPKYANAEAERLSQNYFDAVENELKQSTTLPYVIVAGHFPIWTVGEHGPTDCLIERLRPLLHKYKVSAYFSGHDHSLQHITNDYLGTSVQYITSGAGSQLVSEMANKDKIPQNSLNFHWPNGYELLNGGFLLVNTTQQNMIIQFMKSDGNKLYETVLNPRN